MDGEKNEETAITLTARMIEDSRETRLTGLPISDGVALGKVCLFREHRHDSLPEIRIKGEQITAEHGRLHVALEIAREQLDEVIHDVAERIGKSEAAIFSAQKMILQDRSLIDEMREIIERKRINSEAAVTRVLDEREARILEVDSEYIKERATDIGEVRRRILDALRDKAPSLVCAGGAHCLLGRDRLVVAVELTPSLTVELDTERTLGFVTERGGPTSHAAILARALGVPAVSGVENIHGLIPCGTVLLVSGTTGEVIVWPTEQTVAEHAQSLTEHQRQVVPVDPVDGLQVMANISLAGEVAEAVAVKAEGIGLYRTELEFMAADRLLTEDEQFERYASVVRAMNGRPVSIRLLDLGADKAVGFLDLPKEPNPSLGLRGARLLLARPELLRTQARAIARASAIGPMSVLYPMIVDCQQFLALRRIFLDGVSDLPTENIKHGVMFEVPSACLEAEEILRVADFGSIGTNDLVQYLFAVDRDNDLVARDHDPDKPAFWFLIDLMIEAAHRTGRPLSVCGEAVRDLRLLRRFMDAGVSCFSVSPRLTPVLRRAQL